MHSTQCITDHDSQFHHLWEQRMNHREAAAHVAEESGLSYINNMPILLFSRYTILAHSKSLLLYFHTYSKSDPSCSDDHDTLG